MADLAVQKGTTAGTSLTFNAPAAGGDKFINANEKTFVIAKNTDVADRTITFGAVGKCDFGFDHDEPVIVPAGGEIQIGPFVQRRFNDQLQKVSMTYDDITGLTLAVVTL